MGQIHRYKVQERKLKHERYQSEALIKKLEQENQTLKSKCRIFKASVIKLNEKYPKKANREGVQNLKCETYKKSKFSNPNKLRNMTRPTGNICFEFQSYGYCKRKQNCKFKHTMENRKLSKSFLYLHPHHPTRRKWKPQTAPLESWRQTSVPAASSRRPTNCCPRHCLCKPQVKEGGQRGWREGMSH